MAEKIKLGFKVDTSDVENATDEIIKLENEVSDLKKRLESLEEGTDSFKKIQKSAADTEKKVSKLKGGVGLAGKAFSSLGNIVKTGLGLGIVVKLFEKVLEILGQNQEIVDELLCNLRGIAICYRSETILVHGKDSLNLANNMRDLCDNPNLLADKIQAIEWMLHESTKEAAGLLRDIGEALTHLRDLRLAGETINRLTENLNETLIST